MHETPSVIRIAIVDGIVGGVARIPHNAMLIGADIPYQHQLPFSLHFTVRSTLTAVSGFNNTHMINAGSL